MHELAESIDTLQQRLAMYRRTLGFLEIQRAQLGAFTPPYIWHQFDDTRAQIALVKHELRALDVVVPDHPSDVPPESQAAEGAQPAPDAAPLLLTYQRMLVDQVRYVALSGMSQWSDLGGELADLYVERSLAPFVSPAGLSGTGALPALGALVGVEGARIFVEGAAGSGKTTLLHMLALAYAQRALGSHNAAPPAGWPDPLPLPILLDGYGIAAALARSNAAPAEHQMPSISAFWSAIETWLQYSNLDTLVPTIRQALEQGHCLVLIDGMDNLPPGASPFAFMAALGRFVARYPDNRYVLTCREYHAHGMAPLASFARYALAELDHDQIKALIARVYSLVADRCGFLLPEEVVRRQAALQVQLLADERLQPLARTPLSLVVCVLAHAEGLRLPEARDVVLCRLADLLLAGGMPGQLSSDEPTAQLFEQARLHTAEQRLSLVEPLALGLQERADNLSERSPALSYAEIVALLHHRLGQLAAEQRLPAELALPLLLSAGCRHGLLMRVGEHGYSMPHRHVREYLAARKLAALPDLPARAYALRAAPHWREPLLHALHEVSRRSAPYVARLAVRLLLRPHAGERTSSIEDVLFAGECLLEIGERSWSDQSLRLELQRQLSSWAALPDLALADRVRAGLMLGRLGAAHFSGLLPPLAHVEAGPFLLGTAHGYEDEAPPQLVDLAAFAIGVHPVTNYEYAQFLAEHPAAQPPRYWHDPRFNNPATPVVGVTWHEAQAYCAWLTARLAHARLLAPGQIVRLPLELEWEKAASWDAADRRQRRFPWGEEWSSERANTADGRGAWMTTPIGCYPAGLSPYGLQDCVGNVWEWTASTYMSYPGAANSFCEQGSYTLRGSSCVSNPTHARCTYRSRLPADYWRNHLGFRIVVAHPI